MILQGCVLGARTKDPAPTRADLITRFFTQKAFNLEAKNVDQFLASSSADARAVEDPIARGLVSAPVTGVTMTVNTNEVNDTVLRLPELHVEIGYEYEGPPADNHFRIPLTYSLTQRGNNFKVDKVQIQQGARLPIWANGPLGSSRSEHFLALYRPGTPEPGKALQLAEQARGELSSKLTQPIDQVQVLLLARDRAEYQAFSAHETPNTAIAEAETSFQVTPTEIKVEGRQVVVNLQRLYQDGSAVETFQHELGHLALAPETRPFTPAWVTESAAMFLAGTHPVAVWRAGLNQHKFESISFAELNRASSLGAHDPTGQAATYEYAYSEAGALFLIESFGRQRFFEFYDSFAAVPPNVLYERLPQGQIASDDSPEVTTLAQKTAVESLQRIFGFDENQLDLKTRAWIRSAIKKG
ncbi:MAG: hypothetical protein ABR507_11340 [Actinomycetota bacterium]|nr:hypothetical protein [Actinomycetota bacterium]